jgi:excisionase family DNA binding protein
MEGKRMGHRLKTTPPEPRTLRVHEATATYRIGKTKLFELMQQGKIKSVKVGGRRLILVESLEALISC